MDTVKSGRERIDASAKMVIQENKIYVLKNDKFRRKVGGQTRLMDINCNNCGSNVLVYQKDGPPGHLIKCYIDRIHDPPEYERLQHDKRITSPKQIPNLVCQHCNTVIGAPIVYMDGRLVFRLMQGRFSADLNRNSIDKR